MAKYQIFLLIEGKVREHEVSFETTEKDSARRAVWAALMVAKRGKQ